MRCMYVSDQPSVRLADTLTIQLYRAAESSNSTHPCPSQEGIFSFRDSFTQIPSWEGAGVGFFRDGFRLHSTFEYYLLTRSAVRQTGKRLSPQVSPRRIVRKAGSKLSWLFLFTLSRFQFSSIPFLLPGKGTIEPNHDTADKLHVLANAATKFRKSLNYVAAFARTWTRMPKRRLFHQNQS